MREEEEPLLAAELELGEGLSALHLVFPDTPDAEVPLPPSARERLGSTRWATGRHRGVFPGPGGRELLVLEEKLLRFLDAETGRLREILVSPVWFPQAAWAGDGGEVAFQLGGRGSRIHLWQRGGEVRVEDVGQVPFGAESEIPPALKEAEAGRPDPRNTIVFEGGRPTRVMSEFPLRLRSATGSRTVTFSPHRVHVQEGEGPKRDLMLPDRRSATCLSADGSLLAYASGERLELFDLDAGEPAGSFEVPGARPTAVALSPSGRFLAAGFDDLVLRLFDHREQHLLDSLSGHAARIQSLAFSPQEELLASLDATGVTYLWDGGRIWDY